MAALPAGLIDAGMYMENGKAMQRIIITDRFAERVIARLPDEEQDAARRRWQESKVWDQGRRRDGGA